MVRESEMSVVIATQRARPNLENMICDNLFD